MNKTTTKIITGFGVFAFVITSIGITSTQPAAAQVIQGGTGQALEIGPPVLNLSGNPGQVVTANINIRDIAATNLLVKSQINDFIANGEDGTPKILLGENETSAFSFKSWLTPLPQMTLKPQEVRTIKITITIPQNAAPGGYYGIIRFTGTPPELEGTGVSLSASLGSLVFLTVNGHAKEGMSIEEFVATKDGETAGSIFESAPVVFKERLKNSGNIHEKPTGLVTIKDMFGNTIVTLGVNQPVKDILPDSTRNFLSSLDSSNIGNKLLFGRYTAELSVQYGTDPKNQKTITSTITFWVIPYTLILAIVGGLVAAFFTLRFLIRRYNRHIITKSKNNEIHPLKPKKK